MADAASGDSSWEAAKRLHHAAFITGVSLLWFRAKALHIDSGFRNNRQRDW